MTACIPPLSVLCQWRDWGLKYFLSDFGFLSYRFLFDVIVASCSETPQDRPVRTKGAVDAVRTGEILFVQKDIQVATSEQRCTLGRWFTQASPCLGQRATNDFRRCLLGGFGTLALCGATICKQIAQVIVVLCGAPLSQVIYRKERIEDRD